MIEDDSTVLQLKSLQSWQCMSCPLHGTVNKHALQHVLKNATYRRVFEMASLQHAVQA
jgi:hypothetical protein